MKAKEWALCFVLDFPMGQCFEEDASSLCQRNTKCRGTEVWPVRALGPRRSLARLLDVLGPRGGVPVYGGMGVLVGHLGGCWGEVLVTLWDDMESTGSKHCLNNRGQLVEFMHACLLSRSVRSDSL